MTYLASIPLFTSNHAFLYYHHFAALASATLFVAEALFMGLFVFSGKKKSDESTVTSIQD